MSFFRYSLSLLHIFALGVTAFTLASPIFGQYLPSKHEDANSSNGISIELFASLERLSRLVDIAYCVGTTGIRQPFSCISRCKDFPSFELAATWNTGVFLSDSCGYVAVDHGTSSHGTGLSTDVAHHEEVMIKPNEQSSGAIIIAFRGSYSITNAIVDLSTVPQKYVPYPPTDGDEHAPGEPEHACTNCTVHMGFLMSWQLARQTVLPEVKRLHEKYPSYPIHVIGHSLGGAVGALAALEMKIILGWKNIIVTTFGEPRVGNEGFVKYLDSAFSLRDKGDRPEQRIYRRITHVDDPVPLLPLFEWGYRSHGGEFFISKSELYPRPSDIRPCVGDYDPTCIAGSEGEDYKGFDKHASAKHESPGRHVMSRGVWHLPTRFKLWELVFAHRDYFWRLGLCIPGGDPIDWDRGKYSTTTPNDDEL